MDSIEIWSPLFNHSSFYSLHKDEELSISHNQFWVGSAVSKSKSLLGVGIDFEVIGRAKLELSRYIRSSEDLKTHQFLNENELLTLIFSAKESLYKALYPTAKCFFGFETAAINEIDVSNGTFKNRSNFSN